MHKIHAKEFTLEDFSYEHLINSMSYANDDWKTEWLENLYIIIDKLNKARELFLETKDKKYWWQMIQLLPSSYNQKRTLDFNYQTARAMYFARKNHKLDEWHTFTDTLLTLPYGHELVGVK